MRYIWETGKKRRVLHVLRFTAAGEQTTPMESLCGMQHLFNRSINAPWAFGHKVCKRCRKKV